MYDRKNCNACNVLSTKGQLVLKCTFGVFKFSPKPTNYFQGFLPKPLKEVKSKKNQGTKYH